MATPPNRRKGFRMERNPGMKVALAGLSLAGFAVGWMGFARGGHPGDHAAATPAASSQPAGLANPTPDVQGQGIGVQPNQSQLAPSYSAPTYRTSRGS